MSLSNPSALLWALVAVPIVIFYLLKIRLRKVAVGTTMFWEHVFEEKPPRAIWRQLRYLSSLLVQLLLVALLVFALTDPVINSTVREQQRIVVVLDTSASMQTTNSDGSTFLQQARERVEQSIAGLRNTDEMAVVVTGTQAQVACGLTSHPRTLQSALDRIKATDGPNQMDDAIALSRRLLAGHGRGQVMVVTDGNALSAELSGSANDVSVLLVGEPRDNVAITEFQVRRSLVDPVGYEILLDVANFRNQPARLTVDLTLNESLLDVLPVTLQGGEVRREILDYTGTAGGILKAAIAFDESAGADTGVDALTVDNDAVAVLPERRTIPVTLVTDGNWFLQRALEACELVDLTVTSESPSAVAEGSVLVLDRHVPNPVPSGHVLVIQPDVATDLWSLNGTLPQPLVGHQDEGSPLLQHVRLDNVLMPAAVRLLPVANHNVLVAAVSEDPLYLRFARPAGDVLVLTIDLSQGDLPLRTAFPILLTNAMTWFSGADFAFLRALRTGESMTVPLPPEWQQNAPEAPAACELKSPSGERQTCAVYEDRVTIPPLPTAGVWTLQPEGATTTDQIRHVACNVSGIAESDLRQPTTQSSSAIRPTTASGRPLWFYAVLCAGILLIVEWFLFQRRWIN
ncbi:MAG: BatA and WFA domain-containing protein [Planctomycetaceae bacterium]